MPARRTSALRAPTPAGGVICKFMIKYQVMLEGKNFLLNMEGSIKKYGFYTTRYLEANDPEDAKSKSVQMIREDKKLSNIISNKASDPPIIYLESVHELESFDGVELPGTGYAFYLDFPL